MVQLTPHFTLEELTHSQTAARKGIHNVPYYGSQEDKNLKRLAETMEQVRSILDNKPILVSSGYRSSHVNKAVGGSANSQHMSGLAIDFTCPGFGTPLQICKALEPHMRELGIDQLIHEYDTWVHLGLRPTDLLPRYQKLTINTAGTRNGFG